MAAPLRWAGNRPGFHAEDLTVATVLQRLQKSGDPRAAFFRKKINGTDLLLQERHAFLI